MKLKCMFNTNTVKLTNPHPPRKAVLASLWVRRVANLGNFRHELLSRRRTNQGVHKLKSVENLLVHHTGIIAFKPAARTLLDFTGEGRGGNRDNDTILLENEGFECFREGG